MRSNVDYSDVDTTRDGLESQHRGRLMNLMKNVGAFLGLHTRFLTCFILFSLLIFHSSPQFAKKMLRLPCQKQPCCLHRWPCKNGSRTLFKNWCCTIVIAPQPTPTLLTSCEYLCIGSMCHTSPRLLSRLVAGSWAAIPKTAFDSFENPRKAHCLTAQELRACGNTVVISSFLCV